MTRFNFSRLDAKENAFFERALEYVETKLYDFKERELTTRSLVPKIEGVDAAAPTYVWRSYSRYGMAKVIASYADDLPRADVAGEENFAVIKSLGASYGYNVMEVRQAQKAGTPLNQARANAAARAIEEQIDTLLAKGSAAHNMLGLTNQPNATVFTIPNGASASPLWANKTGAEIIKDLVGIQTHMVKLTKGAEKPDTIAMDLDSHALISTTPYNDESPTTILEVFQRVSPYVKTVIPWLDLETAGAGGTKRLICYRRSVDALGALIPQEFEQFAPQEDGLEFVVPCHARCGGVVAFYPLSISYGDGI
jgi:hypothetical protein